jgi:hypothetical protein
VFSYFTTRAAFSLECVLLLYYTGSVLTRMCSLTTQQTADKVLSQLKGVIRVMYSSPQLHGARVVATVTIVSVYINIYIYIYIYMMARAPPWTGAPRPEPPPPPTRRAYIYMYAYTYYAYI